MTDRILIAGGGIGGLAAALGVAPKRRSVLGLGKAPAPGENRAGLAAALGLAQKGRSVLVLEKAPALGEIGAGIQLGPNAFHAFDYLGVGEAAHGMAVYIDQLRLMGALTP